MGRTPGDLGKRPARTFARKIPLRVRYSMRGTPITNRGRDVGVLNWQAPPGSTYEAEANRFRFGNGSEFPNSCHGGHLRR